MARILVADDLAPTRLLYRRVLEHGGHQVFEATDGGQALRLVTEVQPDAVILDILMPGLDGFEICRAIRADTRLRDTAIVMVSADDEAARAIEAGADAFLLKPFRPSGLLHAVARLVVGRQALQSG